MFSIIKTHDSITPEIRRITATIGRQGMRRLLIYAADEFIRHTQENFGQAGGRYKDLKWKPYTDKYAEKVGSKVPTLKRTGNLYRSIKANAPRSNWIEIYTKVPYAGHQAYGEPRINLPARQFFPVQSNSPSYNRLVMNSERDILRVVSKHMTVMSNGALPILSSNIIRSSYNYGNPFTGPMQNV